MPNFLPSAILIGRRLRFAPPNPVRPRRRADGTVEEIDRRTESINSDTAKTAYGRKLVGYLDILENRTYRAHMPCVFS